MFENNLDKIKFSQPLTREDIRKLRNNKTYLGNVIEIGDRMFSYLLCVRENNEVTKEAKIGVEYELPLLTCDYHIMDDIVRGIPEFWKDI